jgi:hypothetical protein
MDERHRARLPRPLPCRVASAPDTSFGGVLVALSEGGLELVLNTALRPATLVCVDLPGGRSLMAYVARVGREPDGTWLHACELLDPLPPEAVEGLPP